MGHHKKAPVRCPCSLLATLHGAPWMLVLRLGETMDKLAMANSVNWYGHLL